MLKLGIVLGTALVCGAVLGSAATYAYAGWYADLLEYATFNSDTNELTIYLKKEIDPLFIDMEDILVGSCGPSICTFVNLSGDEPILVGDNRKSVVITLTTAQQDAMSRTIPQVKLDIGAFKSPGGGSRNEPEQAPIVMPGEKPASLLERAEYVVELNNLVLYLRDKIDPSSLEPTYIHVQVYLPDGVYDLVESTRLSNDQKSIIIKPTTTLKNELLTTRDPTVLLLIGTYRSESDGIVNGKETAQIVIRGDRPPLPTHIKFLESAAYNSATGELALRFNNLIDTSSINVERIELVGSHNAAGRPLSDYGFRWDDASGLRAFFVHDAGMRHALLAVENLSVRLDAGAYQSYDNGVSNGVEEAPVEILGQHALGRAVYAVASNELVLHFAEKVNPIRTGYLPITIKDGCCRGIGSLGVQDVRSGDDKRSIIYQLDIDSKNDLVTAADPGVRLFPGVYKIDATGFGNGLETVPVTIDWENAVLEPTLLDHAEYAIASNELTLFFTEEVNPLYADDLPITVWYSCCYSSDLEILHFRTGDDGRTIIYYPDIFSRSGLLTFKDDLRVQLHQGVYTRGADGLVNGFEDAPIVVHGSLITFLERAEYDAVSNEVVLYFMNAIDQSSINALGIMLTGCDHTGCGYHTALTDQGPVRVAIDGKSVALEPTQQSRARLLTMANPVVHFGIGTYGASDGAVNGPEEMPVVVLRKDGAPNLGLLKPVRFLEAAIYDADERRLSLEFGWEVDPHSVNTSLIRLTGSHASSIVNITLSNHEFNLLDSDLFHIVAESDSGILDVLQSLTDLTVHLGVGAYKSLYGGVPNDVEETPVAVWVTLLERAEYNIDSNKLTLYFAEEVDPSHADHIPMAIQDGCCFGTAFRPLNIQVGDDGKSIVYEPRTSSRNDLLAFSDPRVQLFQGVYARSTDGLVNGFEEVPVTVQGGPLATLLERAEYDVNSNEVVLHFTDAIDLPTLQARGIAITGCDNTGCSSAITLTDQGPVRMASDGKSVVLEPTWHGRLKLLVMTNPTIHLGAGTYRTADGTINEPEKTSVMVIREAYSPDVLADDVLLASAEYSANIGKLTLNFDDHIDLSLVDIGRIRLSGLHNTADIDTLLHDQGFYQIGSSPHQLIFVHDLRWQDLLLTIDNLSIHLDPGAYKSLSGVVNNAEETQVRILDRVA